MIIKSDTEMYIKVNQGVSYDLIKTIKQKWTSEPNKDYD